MSARFAPLLPDLNFPSPMAGEVSRKRQQPDGDPQSELECSQPKRSALDYSREVLFRIVVPSREIGKVIGKEGHRIQRIREETKATIKIVDPITRHEDRVIIITSQDDDTVTCSAESALHSIARLLLAESSNDVGTLKTGADAAPNMVRLLITGCQIGCLIGVYGQFIEEVKKSSGAMLMIFNPNQLMCFSAQESDQIVQISGEVPEVLTALEKIGCKLRENPPLKVVPRRSMYSYTYTPAYFNPYNSAAPNLYPAVTPAAEHVTYEMMIMENLVGGFIGIHGCNISKIRHDSGATIKITGVKGENHQRLITFGGNSHQVAVARMLVENYVCSQLMRQSQR